MKEIKDKPDVSIVVTVHNAEKYLDECLYSVCNQTYRNIEIICVDGGSTDSSPDILKRFAMNDQRIRLINDPNTSYGHKLNIGFKAAEGSYVGILESDDQFCRDMVENLYSIAIQYGVDVVGGNVYRSFDYKGKKAGYEIQTYSDISYYDRMITKKMEPIRYAHGAIFACLYKKSFLKEKDIKINETPGAAFQDQGFSFLTDILAETAYYINKPVYQYRVDNPGSSVYDDKKVFEIAWEMQFIEEQLKSRKVRVADIWREFWKLKYSSYISNMYRLSNIGRNQFKDTFKTELMEDIAKGYLKIEILEANIQAILLGFVEDDEYFEKYINGTTDKTEKKLCKVLDHALNKTVVIFGAGKIGKCLSPILGKICISLGNSSTEVKCFCDNSVILQGTSIDGKKVLSVEQAIKNFPDAVYIVANAKHYENMFKQLRDYGIKEEKICFFN